MQTATTAGAARAASATASSRPSITDAGVVERPRAHGHRTLAEIAAASGSGQSKKRSGVQSAWTDEQTAHLVDLYGQQLPRKKIAEAMGISVGSLEARATRLRAAGVDLKPLKCGMRDSRYCACGTPLSRRSSATVTMCAKCQRASLRLPVPADLAEVAAGKGVRTVAKHYGVGVSTVRSWVKEKGLPRLRSGHSLVVAPAAPSTATLLRQRAAINRIAPKPEPGHRHGGDVGRAAEFLQRRDPIWRCRADGTADPKGGHWRFLGRVKTDAEIIERAEAKGWKADAWSALPTTITKGEIA